MASDFSDAGVMRVNGQWVTAVRYEVLQGDAGMVDLQLRFLNERKVIASARVASDLATQLLGTRNMEAMRATGTAPDSALQPGHQGVLRGERLAYRELDLPAKEQADSIQRNAIEWDAPERAALAPTDPSTEGRSDSAIPVAGASDDQGETPPRPDLRVIVPEAVARQFVREGTRFLFPDRTLAFIDRGSRLVVRTHNLAVIRSVVEIAQARGWTALKVSGTREFREQVWQEARQRGIAVNGQDLVPEGRPHPTPGTSASPSVVPDTDRDHLGAAARSSAPGSAPSADVPRRMIAGILIEHAAAPYRFDHSQKMSYFARLRTAQGERTVWGVDLERALTQSPTRPGIGDEVILERRGSQPVAVKAQQRDAHGQLIGDRTIVSRRNEWVAEKPEFFAQRALKAEAIRRGDEPAPDLLARFPDLRNALLGIRLGEEFARQLTATPGDQERLIRYIREGIADAVAIGRHIRMPPLKEPLAPRAQARGQALERTPGRSPARSPRGEELSQER